MQNPRTLALCGVGRMGQIRADCIEQCSEHFKITHVIDPISFQLRDAIAAKHKAKVANYLHEVIDQVEGVILCTPTIFHGPDVKLCIEKGKPVFSEKPLAFTKKEIFDCYEAASKAKVPVFAAYNRRSAPSFRKMKSESKPQDIHRISFVFRDNPMPPVELLKTLGDIYEDVSCHNLDLALWFLQEKPVRVYAKSSATFNDQGVIDCAAAILEFTNNRAVLCDWSRKSTTLYDERVEIFSKDRTITADIKKSDGNNGYSFREAYWDSYYDEICQFKVIVDDYYSTGSFRIERPYEYCLWVVDIVNALQRSAISGKEEFVCPSDSIPLGIIGHEPFSQYILKEVISSNLWDYFNIQECQAETKNDNLKAFYLCDDTLYKNALQLLDDKKHLLLEKQVIKTVTEYSTLIRKARQNNLKLTINFNRRYEKQFIEIKKTIQNHIGDLQVQIESSSNSHTSKTLNHVTDNIDLAVFLASPFVATEVLYNPNDIETNLLFTKSDGSTLYFKILQNETAGSNFTKISVQDKVYHKEGKEEDSERLQGQIASLTAFYKALQFNQVTEDSQSYWTYHLLELSQKKYK